MALSAGRSAAIAAVKAALDNANAAIDKDVAFTNLATSIVDAVIALVQTGTVVVISVSGVTTGPGISGPGAGTIS